MQITGYIRRYGAVENGEVLGSGRFHGEFNVKVQEFEHMYVVRTLYGK